MGKTTLLLTLMGITRLRKGRLSWRGSDLTVLPTHSAPTPGSAGSPRNAASSRPSRSKSISSSLPAPANGPCDASTSSSRVSRNAEIISATSSPAGEQQMLAIGRALMVNPTLLLLDEPMEGLAPVVVQELASLIRRMVGQSRMALILVEQHARLALGLTSDALVLERGRVVHGGPSLALLADPASLGRLVGVA